MSIYAISDLHLSFSGEKPMDIFGGQWEGHEEKIRKNWMNTIKENDIVLLPGDFSWAMYIEEAHQDFTYLNELPGKKILSKGNHDYWWTTITKMKKFLDENNFQSIDFLYNNSFCFEDKIICGTRGWAFNDTKEDQKIVNREFQRLEISLKSGVEQFGTDKEIIVCGHYPPIINMNNMSVYEKELLQLMKRYNVKKCIYGHLHGIPKNSALEGIFYDIEYKMVSCDYTDFELIKIYE